jgi:hypothetical protein
MESIFNFNELLEFYRDKKREIVKDFNPDNFISFIKDGQICEKSLFENPFKKEQLYAGYSCKNCKKLSEIFYDFFNNPNNEFQDDHSENVLIPFESDIDENYTIEIKKENYVNSSYEIKSELKNTKFYKKLSEISSKKYCGLQGDPGNTTLLSFNVWLNNVLINWILEETFESLGVPKHVPELLSSFECSENGYKVIKKDYDSLVNKDSLNLEEAVGILYQIASIWQVLQSKYFIHGSITIDKLHFRYEPIDYITPMGDRIYSPITLIIDGFNFSSIYISENTRIIPNNRGRGVDLELSVEKFKPIIEASKKENDTMVYKTQMGSEYFFNVMRYSGYPLFGGSYDMYSIFLSLMSWCMFRNVVKDNPKLMKVWSEMFYDPIDLPVPNERNIRCSFKIGNLLGNKNLYCDAISRLMKLLKKYYPVRV